MLYELQRAPLPAPPADRPTGRSLQCLSPSFLFPLSLPRCRRPGRLGLSLDNPGGRINDDEWISDDEGVVPLPLLLLLMD